MSRQRERRLEPRDPAAGDDDSEAATAIGGSADSVGTQTETLLIRALAGWGDGDVAAGVPLALPATVIQDLLSIAIYLAIAVPLAT